MNFLERKPDGAENKMNELDLEWKTRESLSGIPDNYNCLLSKRRIQFEES